MATKGLLRDDQGTLGEVMTMPTQKLTKRVVDAATPRARTLLIRDTDVKGFCLVVTPAGSKSYALDYRAGHGRAATKRRFVIGKHGSPFTPEMARKEALRLLAEIAKGEDPAEARKAASRTMRLAELCDLYLAEGVAHKKPLTIRADRGRIENHIKPTIGHLRIDRVTRADVERMLRDVTAGKTAAPAKHRGRGHAAAGDRGTAGQALAVLGAPYIGFDKVWLRIRKAAGLDDVRLHDLRHSFASFGAAGGDSLLVIGKLLGHRNAATTERYSHLSADPMRRAAEAIGSRIKAAMERKPSAEVVPLRRA